VFVAFVIAYAGVRFLLEFARADDRGGLFGLSTSQLVGIALIGAGVWVHQKLTAQTNAALAAGAA
jgi:phosphatidylglycerol:prolipoprotein diacylglycerol transferase